MPLALSAETKHQRGAVMVLNGGGKGEEREKHEEQIRRQLL